MGLGFQWHHSHSEDNVAQTQLTAAAADFVAAPVGQGLPGNYSLAYTSGNILATLVVPYSLPGVT